MKQQLQIIIATLFALLSVGFVHAQEENALDNGRQIVDGAQGIVEALQNGYTTPMRIVGSKGNASVDIGIDTVRYVRSGENTGLVSFDAHVGLQIPFAIEDGEESTKINFKGEDLILAGEGSSKIYMETGLPPMVLLRDKISLRIIADEETFVSFGCDGVEEIGLHGEFIFDPQFIKPAQENSGDTVKASFATVVSDWDDLLLDVQFNTPFKISGGGDFVFTVNDVMVDFSTQSNVPGFTFPAGYETAFPDDVNLWTGFAIKEIAVTPPSEITDLGGSETNTSYTYSVSNMLIDELGLTGAFMAKRAPQLASNEANSGLNLSIDTIGITIAQNRITGGILGGAANVPFLKDEATDETLRLGISGQIQYEVSDKKLHYRLSAATLNSQTYKVPFTNKATITLDQACAFTAGNITPQQKFGATLLLNGSLNIKADLQIQGIRFEGFTLSSFSPHFDWKYFGLVGTAGVDFAGFSVTLKELALEKGAGEDEDKSATLIVAGQIALMGDAMSIGAEAKFRILAGYEQSRNKWEFKKFSVDRICLNMDYSAFRFNGCIERFEAHSMYGDGFKGDITLQIKSLGFGVDALLYFGKTDYNKNGVRHKDPFKYWFTQITADVSGLNIMLFPPAVKLASITGGAYQRMSNSLCTAGEKNPGDMKLSDIMTPPEYVPDVNTKFGFIAGVGACIASENLVTVKVLLEMAFNSHCGLRYVSLTGMGSFLSDDVNDAPVRAVVNVYYNVEDKILSLLAGIDANFFDIIKGGGDFVLYTSPKQWYCNVGTVEKSIGFDIAGLLKAQAYFMAGAIPSQLPPLNPKITALFGQEGYSKAGTGTLDGNGFAFGVALGADCGFNKDRGFIFAYIEIDGGIDALVNFSSDCGANPDAKWRGKAQLYFYMDGAAGVRVRKKKFEIVSLTTAASLAAEIPAPYFFEGKVAFKYKVLFVKGNAKVKYSKGTRC